MFVCELAKKNLYWVADSLFTFLFQISVRVGDWQEVSAVSVDRVGTYFRHAEPVPMSALDYGGTELPPARIVFDVTLDGSARYGIRRY